MIDISIIYVNYNTMQLIADSIDSVLKFTKCVSYEILVIDNNTQDLSALNSYGDMVKVIQMDKNLGFGCANNEAAKWAEGKYLLFLNPDTLLLNNAIKELKDTLDLSDRIGVCGGNLFDINLNPMHSHFYINKTFGFILRTFFIPSKKLSSIQCNFNFTDRLKDVGYITGADLMIRKTVFDKVGGFNKNIFMYYEDVDLCYRVKKRGYRIVSQPKAHIMHLEGKSFSPSGRDRRMYLNASGQAQFLHDNYSKNSAFAIVFLIKVILFFKKKLSRIIRKDISGLCREECFNELVIKELKNRYVERLRV